MSVGIKSRGQVEDIFRDKRGQGCHGLQEEVFDLGSVLRERNLNKVISLDECHVMPLYPFSDGDGSWRRGKVTEIAPDDLPWGDGSWAT